jgi:hypothetical protein
VEHSALLEGETTCRSGEEFMSGVFGVAGPGQAFDSNLEEWTIGKIAPLITYEMMLRRFYD